MLIFMVSGASSCCLRRDRSCCWTKHWTGRYSYRGKLPSLAPSEIITMINSHPLYKKDKSIWPKQNSKTNKELILPKILCVQSLKYFMCKNKWTKTLMSHSMHYHHYHEQTWTMNVMVYSHSDVYSCLFAENIKYSLALQYIRFWPFLKKNLFSIETNILGLSVTDRTEKSKKYASLVSIFSWNLLTTIKM